jgi:sec-independent protein translocase protein TatC
MGIFSNNNLSDKKNGAEMSFMQHLEALRWHLVRASFVIIFFCIVFLFFSDFLFKNIIFAPRQQSFPTYALMCKVGKIIHIEGTMCIAVDATKKLVALTASEQISTFIWICLLAGIVCGFPYLLWEIWKFIRPALKNNEAKPVRGFVFVGTFLFVLGILFGYFILFPLSYNFLINFQITETDTLTMPTIDDYISLISTMCLVTGIVFELPIVVYFLTRLGIFTPKFMRKYRKHAVVIILILSAVITPSPDVVSQLIVFTPLYMLYEISIFVSAQVVKKHKLPA